MMSRNIGLPLGRVSHQDVQHMVSPAVRNVLNLQMQKLRNILQLIARKRSKRRHAPLRAALLEERCQSLAMIVAEHCIRGDQAGPRRAARLWTVAKGTVFLVQRRPARRGRFYPAPDQGPGKRA